MTFVVLDLGTANGDPASVCQAGVAEFSEQGTSSTWYSLVNPEDDFDDINVLIHGISEEKVQNAPLFPQLYQQVRNAIEGRIVVTHSWFEQLAFERVLEKYSLIRPEARWLDVTRVIRRAWPDRFARKGYGLAKVSRWCGIEFVRHKADEEARAVGEVLLRAVSDSGLGVEDWLVRARQPISPDAQSRRTIEGNPEGPLAGERVVFTGALSMPRREAAALAAEAGCDVAAAVSKKVTLVVVGQQDLRRLEGHSKSSKHRKAEELISQGHPLRILGENDFRRLVDIQNSG